MTTLVARTGEVGAVPDLLGAASTPDGIVWHDDRGSLAGRGQAVRIDLPSGLADRDGVRRVADILDAIETDDALRLPGTGPVALGSLPFDPAAPAHLVVPEVIWGQRGGRAWVTTVAPPGETPRPPDLGDVAAGEPPDEFAMVSSYSHPEWRALIDEAVARIRAGALDKVVLARRVDVTANRPFLIPDVLARLVALYQSCMVFHVDGFLGASPELLIERRGDAVASHPLAGTVARSGDAVSDEALVAGLMGSLKDRWEHRLVIDMLSAALGAQCRTLDVPDRPTVLGLRNVSHLATHLSGTLAADASGRVPTALELAADVHPTPAIGGVPTKDAIAHIQAVEGFDRRGYAGPVGWVDSRGDGVFAVGIRCAQVDGPHAAMFAGVGVVADSDAAAELAETQLKLQALLAALVRP
ncbi:MAG: isochorismate synthase [Acidimicrobiales bacterium]